MAIGDEIRAAREAKGMSQEELARAIGVKQPSIVKIESGLTVRSRFLADIRKVLELDGAPERSGRSSFRPSPRLLGDRDFPIYGTVEGGTGAIVITSDVMEWVQRPWYMRDAEGYGVLVIGESMRPAFKPGDIAVVHPMLPLVRECDAIFSTKRESPDVRAMIKEFQRADAAQWFVRQHNPPVGETHEFSLSKREWPTAERVVGKYSGG